jgi:hypothetical protein
LSATVEAMPLSVHDGTEPPSVSIGAQFELRLVPGADRRHDQERRRLRVRIAAPASPIKISFTAQCVRRLPYKQLCKGMP